jgi:RNA polymerase sigma factor (sigma-70 family)
VRAGCPAGNVFWQGRTTVSELSFENLVNEHGGRVFHTALRVLRDESLAHDVHQEVFLAVWRRWGRYNGDTNWPAYLYRATVRKALELARRRAVGSRPGWGERPRSPEKVVRARRAAALRAGATCEETPDGVTTSGPAEVLQADELQQRVAAALARLPRRQADAFVLCRLEGLEAVEAAGIMGCAPETVRVHLHRALLRLARALQEYLGPAGP